MENIISFLHSILTNSIKYVLTSGILSYEDLFYDNSFVSCTLLGGKCNPACPLFLKNNYPCEEYSGFERRYVHIGELITLIYISQDKNLEDKDFYVKLVTGKSIREDDPSYDNQYKNQKISHSDITEPELDKKEEIENKLVNVISKTVSFPDIDENDIDMFPKAIRDSYKMKKEGFKPNVITLNEFINIYIDKYMNEDFLESDEADAIIQYLMIHYEPVDSEFPLNIRFSRKVVHQLIIDTADMDKNSPRKWTKSRMNIIENEDNPYIRYLYLEDGSYAWLNYCYIEEWNKRKEDLDRFIITARYIINFIIQEYAFLFTNNYIIFYKNTDLDKIKSSFDKIKNVLQSVSKNKFKYIFFKDQLEHSYIFNIDKENIKNILLSDTDKIKKGDAISNTKLFKSDDFIEYDKKFEKANIDIDITEAIRITTSNSDDIFKKLKKTNVLEKVDLI